MQMLELFTENCKEVIIICFKKLRETIFETNEKPQQRNKRDKE